MARRTNNVWVNAQTLEIDDPNGVLDQLCWSDPVVQYDPGRGEFVPHPDLRGLVVFQRFVEPSPRKPSQSVAQYNMRHFGR